MKHRFFTSFMVVLIFVNLIPLSVGANINSPLQSNISTEFKRANLSKESYNEDSIIEDLSSLKQISDEEISTEYSVVKSEEWHFNNTNEWKRFAYDKGNRTRLIVGLDRETSNNLHELERIVVEHQAEIVNEISIRNEAIAVVVESSFKSVTSLVEALRQVQLASYIEPNIKFQTQLVPNDPYWDLQWGPQKIGADWAWNTTVGDPSVLVAVVDTGVDYTHPDLITNYVALGYDWTNSDSDPIDDHGHGTHCAGIIGAVLNNSLGIAGVANVSVMAEKVLDYAGWGYADWVADGIIHAVDSGADIISMSIGSYGWGELLLTAVDYAYDSGVLMVAAAGNDGTNMKLYPAGYDEVVAVSATDQYDNTAWWSNWGDWIELAAPGVDIYSTVPWGYEFASGTSMACPHVAGAAALVWSRYPNRTRDWVRLWLQLQADDLGIEGFDIHYGHGRVNARNAIEEIPPAHELIVYQWETPPYVEPADTGRVNATILNFGENNETNVTVQLLANDSIVDITTIGSIAAGSLTTASLLWSPTVEGLYNLTLYVMPVPGEGDPENNMLSQFVYVGYPTKAVVLHSAGNLYSEIITNWQVLNNEWHLFGDSMVYIDYTTLNKENITYLDIVSTEADVLIISCAADPYLGWQFTDSEIDAIERYVHEGHGFIATAGTLYYGVPNNNKLGALFGLDEEVDWGATSTDLLSLENSSHPIFASVPNPLVFPMVGTSLPDDGFWDSNELVGGEYLAMGYYQESAIVAFRSLVYISPWLEIIPPHYRHHLQLLYNAMIWSTYQKPKHDLVVTLEAPRFLEPDDTTVLNMTICNQGINNETDVELHLLINGEEVENRTISKLPTGESYQLDYLWHPTVEGVYNLTVYAPPVIGEEFTDNNIATRFPRVRSIRGNILFDQTHGTDSIEMYSIWIANLIERGYVVENHTSGSITPTVLQGYDAFVIPQALFRYLTNEVSIIRDYVLNGGGLLVIGDAYPIIYTSLTSFAGISWASGGVEGITSDIILHPVTEGVNTVYFVAPNSIMYTESPAIDLLRDIDGNIMLAVSSQMEGKVLGIGDEDSINDWCIEQADNLRLANNMIDWLTTPRSEHDLAVTLNISSSIELGTSVVVNATVRNIGLNNETDVEFYLLINGNQVKNKTVPELLVDNSSFLSYVWTPENTGEYNVTVYVPPIPEEARIDNNAVSKKVGVFYYTRVYLPHRWVGDGTPMAWHYDDFSSRYTLPFDFPFYGISYRTIYISSNGLLTFTGPDISHENSMLGLGERLAIAPAWDDWVTYYPQDIYIWESSDKVGIRWYAAACYDNNITADFEVILDTEGVIQFNYASNNGPISATIGISNGAGHIIAEDVQSIDFIDTIHFLPFYRNIAVQKVTTSPSQVYAGERVNINVTVANEGKNPESFKVRVYHQNESGSFSPAGFLASVPNDPHPPNAMWVEPMFKDLTDYDIGNRFNLTVWLNLTDLSFAWQVQLEFETTYLNARRAGYTEGSTSGFFAGHTTLPVSPIIDNAVGYVRHGETLIGSDYREPGYGSLCWIEFEVISKPSESYEGEFYFHPHRTFVFDPDLEDVVIILYDGAYGFFASPPSLIGEEMVYLLPISNMTLVFTWNTSGIPLGNYTIIAVAIPVEGEINIEDNTFVGGTIQILGIHDAAVTRVLSAKTWVYQGQTVSFNITVENQGDLAENVTVTLSTNVVGGDLISTETIENLLPGENKTITLLWVTIEVAPCQNYTVIAVATIGTSDSYPANNTLESGKVKIRLLGDLNGDDMVDMRDIGAAVRAYGSFPEHPRWNPDYDINQDKIIDLRDISLVAKHFGETCP